MAARGFQMVQETQIDEPEDEPMGAGEAGETHGGVGQTDVGQGQEGEHLQWGSATVSSHGSEEPPSFGDDSIMMRRLDEMIRVFRGRGPPVHSWQDVCA